MFSENYEGCFSLRGLNFFAKTPPLDQILKYSFSFLRYATYCRWEAEGKRPTLRLCLAACSPPKKKISRSELLGWIINLYIPELCPALKSLQHRPSFSHVQRTEPVLAHDILIDCHQYRYYVEPLSLCRFII